MYKVKFTYYTCKHKYLYYMLQCSFVIIYYKHGITGPQMKYCKYLLLNNKLFEIIVHYACILTMV